MPVSGASIAYATAGGLVLFSGIKGTTIASTVKAALAGNLTVTSTEPVGTTATGVPAAGTPAATVSAGTSSQNLNTIGLVLHQNYGYSPAAAAGIAGCVAGESGGNPESAGSGGEGLIGWTPPSKLAADGGTFGGTPSADLQSQIGAIDAYNRQNWAQYIPMLNAQTDPVGAAQFYSQYFERPAVLYSDVRSSVAQSVYAYIRSH
jgi:hypothetical protein